MRTLKSFVKFTISNPLRTSCTFWINSSVGGTIQESIQCGKTTYGEPRCKDHGGSSNSETFHFPESWYSD